MSTSTDGTSQLAHIRNLIERHYVLSALCVLLFVCGFFVGAVWMENQLLGQLVQTP